MPAVAPWSVSRDVSVLADRALSRAELRGLAAALLRIQPLACEIERRAPTSSALLLRLKDAIADAEDLLDDLHHHQVGSALSTCAVTLFRKPARRLKQLLARLDHIHIDAERLVGAVEPDGTASGVRLPNRVTGSVLAERKVFGRDRECGEIVGRLVGGSGEGCCSAVPVVAIVGHGGMGKTTVAQCVYNDARIEEHFDMRAWVCVWDRSDEVELTREMLQSIGGAGDGLCSDSSADLEILQEKLERLVVSKKFLLVLDDVWNDDEKTELENRGLWEKVLAPLRYVESGSMILVTTRMKLVAEILNAVHVVSLDGLGSSDCWLLLKEAALGGESIDVSPQLQEIGRAISAKVKGLPLAAKALGQMLSSTRSTRRWRTLLDSEICDSIIISSLQLSYQHLPGHLQRCFAYCSIFPRSWRFDRYKLVKIWGAQGFVQPSTKEGQKVEDLGKEYFDDLVSRSFFQTVKKDQKTYYFLDSLMHDLAQYFSAHDCIKIEEGMPDVIPTTVRHLSVTTDYLPQLKSKCRLGRLRTLLVFSNSSLALNYFPSYLLAEFKNLRALDLSESEIVDLPETIGQLVHLRYLALCNTIKRLPKCIYRLQYHVQVDVPLLVLH